MIALVKTRHEYQQYIDLYRLAELNDLPMVYIDEIDAASDHTYILPVQNGEVYDGWPDARARIIHWNFEWYEYPPVPGIRERWSIDKFWADKTGAKYVPLGGDARLRPVSAGDYRDWFDAGYDVAYFGYMIPRRNHIRHALEAVGVICSPTSAWGPALHDLLDDSRLYLHVHQHEHVYAVPWLRLVRAAAYRLPVISETLAAPGILGHGALMQCDWEYIPQFVKMHLKDGRLLEDYGRALHQFVCVEHPFLQTLMQHL